MYICCVCTFEKCLYDNTHVTAVESVYAGGGRMCALLRIPPPRASLPASMDIALDELIAVCTLQECFWGAGGAYLGGVMCIRHPRIGVFVVEKQTGC